MLTFRAVVDHVGVLISSPDPGGESTSIHVPCKTPVHRIEQRSLRQLPPAPFFCALVVQPALVPGSIDNNSFKLVAGGSAVRV